MKISDAIHKLKHIIFNVKKDKDKYLTFTALQDSVSIYLKKENTPYDIELQYKKNNNNNWISYDLQTPIILENINDKILFKNKYNRFSKNENNYYQFEITGKIKVTGNINSLINQSQITDYCYYNLFNSCSSLTTAPELPAETLAYHCYESMFANCENLSSIPSLPAINLESYCYANMFENCTNLNSDIYLPADKLAPYCYYNMFKDCTNLVDISITLPATKLDEHCYQQMFNGCQFLTSVPELPAANLSAYCYAGMFRNCISLCKTPTLLSINLASGCYAQMFYNCNISAVTELPAINLAPYCYYQMFTGCSNLSTAPALPASTLVNNCYDGMFIYCPALTAAPYLPATTLVSSCYNSMFINCYHLNSLSVNFTDWSENKNSTLDWTWMSQTYGTAPTGIFYKPVQLPIQYDESHIPENWYILTDYQVSASMLTVIGAENNSAIRLIKNGDPNFISLQYKLNNDPWKVYFINDIISLNINDKVYFMSNTTKFSIYNSDYYQFEMSGKIKIEGTINSLIAYSSLTNYCFYNLFNNCSSLIEISQDFLPATTLYSYCYANMFYGCTNLTTPPALPATNLADYCYLYMFRNCINLTTAPVLSAINLANWCYGAMFYCCYNLTSAPSLPASTINQYSYWGMFADCSSLINPPILSAQNLNIGCYSWMFQNCTNLITVPQLPASSLAQSCYRGMFYNCSKLTAAPYLPADIKIPLTKNIQNCYTSMFENCTNLNEITVNFTDWIYSSYFSNNWVSGVSPTGTFIKPTDLTETYDNNHIPNGWTVMNYDQILNFTATENNSGIRLTSNNIPQSISIQYRLNTPKWEQYNLGEIIPLNINDKILFKSTTSGFSKDYNNYYYFEMSGKLAAAGNINSLIYCKDLTNGCFIHLFENCSSLISSPKLPYTTLAEQCYVNMFYGCTNLSTAPALPAKTLKLGCYDSMFFNCTNLIEAPQLLAEYVASQCYKNMFMNCTKLTDAPMLLPTKLSTEFMAGPNCFEGMFYNCENLSSININFIDWKQDINATYNWIHNVSESGIFYIPSGFPESAIIYDTSSHIPYNWTVMRKNALAEYYPDELLLKFYSDNIGSIDDPIISVSTAKYTQKNKNIELN